MKQFMQKFKCQVGQTKNKPYYGSHYEDKSNPIKSNKILSNIMVPIIKGNCHEPGYN